MNKHIEEELSAFSARKERCIATDGEYTDKEMVEILSNYLKRSYEEDMAWLRTSYQRVLEGERERLEYELHRWDDYSTIINFSSRDEWRGYRDGLRFAIDALTPTKENKTTDV